jgi:hypothetical protein
MNKEQLQKKGYQMDNEGYVDLTPKKKELSIEELKSELNLAIEMRNMFLEDAQKRGKVLSIIIPLISREDMTDLLSELYEMREIQKSHRDIARLHGEIFSDIKEVFKNPDLLNILKDLTKCQPTKKQPKRKLQKKKLENKKK